MMTVGWSLSSLPFAAFLEALAELEEVQRVGFTPLRFASQPVVDRAHRHTREIAAKAHSSASPGEPQKNQQRRDALAADAGRRYGSARCEDSSIASGHRSCTVHDAAWRSPCGNVSLSAPVGALRLPLHGLRESLGSREVAAPLVTASRRHRTDPRTSPPSA